MRYLIALLALLFLADFASACHLQRLGRVRERVVERHRIVHRTGTGLLGFGFIGSRVVAAPCAAPACLVPAAPVPTPKKEEPKK